MVETMKRSAVLAVILLCLAPAGAHAVAPGTIDFQGLLLDDQGDPVNGPADFSFAFFDAATGGTALWSEVHDGVAVMDGVYDVVLGSTTPITPAILAGGTVYVEISVEGEVLSPRQLLHAVPYAIESGSVGGVDSTFVTQIYQNFPFDGGDPPNDDPSEGLADVDGDGLANFIDPDNDGDGLPDGDELAQGSDINLVTPTLTGFDPASAEASVTSLITLQGTSFDASMSVSFGSESPTPQNVSSTHAEVSVGPQPAGVKTVTLTLANGQSDGATFPFLENVPVISSITPPSALAQSTTLVTVTGSGFAGGLEVSFGSQVVTPTSITPTSFQATVGPQPRGTVTVTVGYPSGQQDTDLFWFDDPANPRAVFVTAVPVIPNFGGTAGGDAICAAAASAASLPGTFRAWLSDISASPATTFTRHGPFARTDGTVIADNWTDLTDGTIQAPIDRDELAMAITPAADYWTGTLADGTVPTFGALTCSGWTVDTSPQLGVVGNTGASDYLWTTGNSLACDTAGVRLLCFEQ
jgi:hypothetical protein